jgi:hypothetical protein
MPVSIDEPYAKPSASTMTPSVNSSREPRSAVARNIAGSSHCPTPSRNPANRAIINRVLPMISASDSISGTPAETSGSRTSAMITTRSWTISQPRVMRPASVES